VLRESYLDTVQRELRRLKQLADTALAQLSDRLYFQRLEDTDNCAAVIVKHLSGNMLSRWRDFLSADGEKPDRDRDSEFVLSDSDTREALHERWEKAWQCLFDAVVPLQETDLSRTVFIRGESHSVLQAINRQLTHYAYHTGQLVFLAKHLAGDRWQTLSVARGESQTFNERPEQYLGGNST
jgi:hypothetical protein